MSPARPDNSPSLLVLAAVSAAFGLLLLASACSTSAESDVAESEVTGSEVQVQAQAEPGETDEGEAAQSDPDEPNPVQADPAVIERSATPADLTAAECEALDAAQIKLSFAGGLLLIDAVSIDDLDVPELDGLIAMWRPYQDVPGLLGTARQDLDNLSRDFLAASEGRPDEMVSAGPAVTLDLVHEAICG